VDELAHTNAPGSRHSKRFQDVEDLLDAGINVISTLNVQHLESLYDLIEKSTGVKVKERVPDYVVGMADQLVNVDLSAEDLRERLSSGKVYPAERVHTALANFFTPENLTRLRELSLAEMAHLLDRHRRERANGPTTSGAERVMVCISSGSPNAEPLLRKAARLAARLGCPWYAVYIQTPAESLERVPAATQRRLANALALAHQLGGVPMTFKGEDVVNTIAAFAKEYSITHILLGRTLRPWYRRWFGLSLLDRLQEAVRGADLTVVDT
jgi:two-component system sensor histidine kinase KdpD